MHPRPALYRVFGLDGEYDRFGMRDLIRHGEVTSTSEVALVGSEEWKTAGAYPELQHYLGLVARQRVEPAAEVGGATWRPVQVLGSSC